MCHYTQPLLFLNLWHFYCCVYDLCVWVHHDARVEWSEASFVSQSSLYLGSCIGQLFKSVWWVLYLPSHLNSPVPLILLTCLISISLPFRISSLPPLPLSVPSPWYFFSFPLCVHLYVHAHVADVRSHPQSACFISQRWGLSHIQILTVWLASLCRRSCPLSQAPPTWHIFAWAMNPKSALHAYRTSNLTLSHFPDPLSMFKMLNSPFPRIPTQNS